MDAQAPKSAQKFRGNYTATVDEAGRLKIPTHFKDLLDEHYGVFFFVTSLDGGKSGLIYPLKEWEKVEAMLDPVPNDMEGNKGKREMRDHANFWGVTVRTDPQGRILVPALLRDSATLKGEVAVVGKGFYLAVANLEAARAHMTQPPSEGARAVLDTLGIA